MNVEKLAKLLGMLGSDHDGEVLNAARAASKMVREAGLQWSDVLDSKLLSQRAMPRAAPRGSVPGWWSWCQAMLEAEDFEISDWEETFLRSISRSRRLSEKQLAVFNRLKDRFEEEV